MSETPDDEMSPAAVADLLPADDDVEEEKGEGPGETPTTTAVAEVDAPAEAAEADAPAAAAAAADDAVDSSSAEPHAQEQTPEAQPRPRPGPRPKHQPIAEPPRWRFVQSARKSMGYDSSAAGTAVQGLSAEELAGKYRAPPDAEEASSAGEGAEIGRVALPTGWEDARSQLRTLRALERRTAHVQREHDRLCGDVVATQQEHQARLLRLRELQQWNAQTQRERDRLRDEVVTAKREKAALEAAREKQEEGERTTAAAAGATKEAASQTVGAATTAVEAGGDGEARERAEDARRKCVSRVMYALIAILLCAVVVLLGVVLSDEKSNSEARSSLRGGTTSKEETRAPTAAPSAVPLFRHGNITRVSLPADPTTMEIIACPNGTKSFLLTVHLGAEPPEGLAEPMEAEEEDGAEAAAPEPRGGWAVVDRCTGATLYRGTDDAGGAPLRYPVAFAGCLPRSRGHDTTNTTTTGVGEGGYVLHLSATAAGGSRRYVLQYAGKEVAEAETPADAAPDGRVRRPFGEGGGCATARASESPALSLAPTEHLPLRTPGPAPGLGT